ncbi:MAG TPA: undecaprenyldiphospho-muramoylpentapeptide beta-N-acetylglucosaminyltransferase [Firmicutes bacterium]|nr:undecaprenyldiphospho-muramoylpentapeptide beta-N-acetylglucosaminyltransferase [Bacillota bacterium]
MKVIVTAGGTGGHIYPALGIVEKIKECEPDSEFIYVGTTNRMEKDIVPKLGIKYVGIEMYGLSKNIVRDIKVALLILKNERIIKKLIDDFKPDIVIGTGGYVTYPVIKAAKAKNVKTFIHEQNSIPGKSNRALARLADKVGVSFKDSIHYFDEKKAIFTGNPCSERALSIPMISRTKYGLSLDKKFVLMVQGSLGSTSVNAKMIEFLNSIDDKDYQVLYITGKRSYDEFKKNNFSKNVFVVPYVENLAGLMKDADIIISRAGASSISEIIALKKLSILIPSPYVANNHQFFNALSCANNKAAIMIEEVSLTATVLKNQIDKLLNDLEMQLNMKLNLSKMQKNDSSTAIYGILKELINDERKTSKN